MRRMVITGFALAALTAGAAQAAPLATPAVGATVGNGITLVEGGCGPGGFRAANGACYPRRPPPPYYRRECPPRFHMTPYGCRRNY